MIGCREFFEDKTAFLRLPARRRIPILGRDMATIFREPTRHVPTIVPFDKNKIIKYFDELIYCL